MKKLFVLSFVFLFAFAACDKETYEPADSAKINGEYTGTFVRIHPTGTFPVANVTMNIDSNRFSGNSDTRNYPAICRGKLAVSNDKLVVTNECMFTADFDGTLIFNGEFKYEVSGNTLKLTKTYSTGFYDQYTLQKQ